MRVAVLATFVACFATSVSAESEFRHGADFVRISAEPCKNEKVVALIEAQGGKATDFRAARAEVNGASYAGCWQPIFDKQLVNLVYEDGDMGLIPFNALKPVKSV